MKHVIFFITHTVLSERHADICFKALSNSKDPLEFDELVLYNSHQHEISNDTLRGIMSKYDLSFIKNVTDFKYDPSTPKTLGGDIAAIRDYCLATYSEDDRVLLLKSEMLVSINLLNEMKKLNNKVCFTPPMLNAKKSTSDDELLDRSKTPYMIFSSEDTFFMEDETRSIENDFRDRCHQDPSVGSIKYLSCSGKSDWSLHYISVGLLPMIKCVSQSWGGCNMDDLKPYWVGAYKSFSIHKYHHIKSVNCSDDRPGDYNQWLCG